MRKNVFFSPAVKAGEKGTFINFDLYDLKSVLDFTLNGNEYRRA